MKTKLTTSQLTVLGLMTAVLLLMAYTPLGYLNIGPLAITFNVIPVAISAIVLGPAGRSCCRSHFRTYKLSSVHRRRRNKRDGGHAFQYQPGICLSSEIPAPCSGRTASGLYFQRNEKKDKYLSFLRCDRILFRIPEYRVFYDGAGCSFSEIPNTFRR